MPSQKRMTLIKNSIFANKLDLKNQGQLYIMCVKRKVTKMAINLKTLLVTFLGALFSP